MSRTKKMSRTKQMSRTKKNKNKNKYKFTCRIIIYDDIFIDEMLNIKEMLENLGGFITILYFKKIVNLQNMLIFNNVNIQIFMSNVCFIFPMDYFKADKSYLFINNEYVKIWEIDRMMDKSVIPLFKSHIDKTKFNKLGINGHYVGFLNDKKNINVNKIKNLFFHNGYSNPLKGTKIIIETWLNKKIVFPLIIIVYNKIIENRVIKYNNFDYSNEKLFNYWKSLKPKYVELPDIIKNNCPKHIKLPKFYNVDNVYLCSDETLDKNIIKYLQNISEVHLCPSNHGGSCFNIINGLENKSIILTLDESPMNEIINEKNGILIKSSKGDKLIDILPDKILTEIQKKILSDKLDFDTYNISINDLYNGIKTIIDMSDEDKQKLINKSLISSVNNYNLFKKRFTNIINNNNFKIKNINFTKQNSTIDNCLFNLNSNQIFKKNVIQYYKKNTFVIPTNKIAKKSTLSIKNTLPNKNTLSIKNTLPNKKTFIPLNIYQAWIGSELPEEYKNAINMIKEVNYEFNHFLYNEEQIYEFIKNNFDKEILNAYLALLPKAFKIDLFRYCLLYMYGGIYIDVKFRPVNNFKLINLVDKTYFVFDTPIRHFGIFNGFIISNPKNKLLLQTINQIVTNVKNYYYGISFLSPTGPLLVGNYYLKNNSYKEIEIFFNYIVIDKIKNIHKQIIIYKNNIILEGMSTMFINKDLYNSYYMHMWKDHNIYDKNIKM